MLAVLVPSEDGEGESVPCFCPGSSGLLMIVGVAWIVEAKP